MAQGFRQRLFHFFHKPVLSAQFTLFPQERKNRTDPELWHLERRLPGTDFEEGAGEYRGAILFLPTHQAYCDEASFQMEKPLGFKDVGEFMRLLLLAARRNRRRDFVLVKTAPFSDTTIQVMKSYGFLPDPAASDQMIRPLPVQVFYYVILFLAIFMTFGHFLHQMRLASLTGLVMGLLWSLYRRLRRQNAWQRRKRRAEGRR